MAQYSESELLDRAEAVLKQNDRESFTVPAADLYPHQWLWDSCFVTIGLRHVDIERAKVELLSLLHGQWTNGMLPNMIFSNEDRRDRELWRSYVSPFAPSDVATTGVTQPPMLAEAVVQIGKKLKLPERRGWYRKMYPHILRYHEWLYTDRDPHKEGPIVLIHPYEGGLDNSPPWISELRKHSMPWWIRLMEKLRLEWLINLFRRDTKHIPPGQRMNAFEALAYLVAMLRLRRKAYNSEAILSRSLFAVEDLVFNCIFIRANQHLKEIAVTINVKIPEGMLDRMSSTEAALNQFWDEQNGQYFSRSFVSHKLIKEPSIATLLPLYAGCIDEIKVKRLVELLKNPGVFGLKWPVPSVPVNSPDFDPVKYWQGPTWINTNWLIIDGLKRYGFHAESAKLRERTLELVNKSGMNEYFNPNDGNPVGAAKFSWTAALTIDLIKKT